MVGICALHLIVRHGQEGYCLIRWTRLVVGAALHALRMASIRATNRSRRLDSAQIFLKRVSVGAPNQFSSSVLTAFAPSHPRRRLGDDARPAETCSPWWSPLPSSPPFPPASPWPSPPPCTAARASQTPAVTRPPSPHSRPMLSRAPPWKSCGAGWDRFDLLHNPRCVRGKHAFQDVYFLVLPLERGGIEIDQRAANFFSEGHFRHTIRSSLGELRHFSFRSSCGWSLW